MASADVHLGVSAALLLGIATNNLNVGLGARVGYTLANNLYFGGTLVYQFGSSSQIADDDLTLKGGKSLVYFGPEGGYDFSFGPVIARPYVGIGPAVLRITSSYCPAGLSCQDSVSNSAKFAVWIGGTLLLPLFRSFFVGADLRGVVVSADNASAVAILGTGGILF